MIIKGIDLTFELESRRGTSIVTGITIPKLNEGETCPVVIMLDGYMGNRNGQGLFYGGIGENLGIGEQICDLGIASVRLDFPGCGDSKESFAAYTVDNMLSDVEVVYHHILENYPIDPGRIGMCCWSNGGRIAALFAEKHQEIRTMVLWAPVAANGSAMWPHVVAALNPRFEEIGLTEDEYYLQLRETAERDGVAEIPWFDGSEKTACLSSEFFDGNDNAKPLDALKKFKGDVLMVVAGKDTCVPRYVFQEIINNTEINWVTIDEADHDFGSETKNNRIIKTVQDVTASYLYRKL